MGWMIIVLWNLQEGMTNSGGGTVRGAWVQGENSQRISSWMLWTVSAANSHVTFRIQIKGDRAAGSQRREKGRSSCGIFRTLRFCRGKSSKLLLLLELTSAMGSQIRTLRWPWVQLFPVGEWFSAWLLCTVSPPRDSDFTGLSWAQATIYFKSSSSDPNTWLRLRTAALEYALQRCSQATWV